MDYDSLRELGSLDSVHGLVFLFHYGGELPSTKRSGTVLSTAPEGVFFARQVITNACATQAILSIVLNATDRVHIGDELTQFHSFCVGAALDAETAGLTISNSAVIRDAHNAFAPPVHFALESSRPKQTEDAFHFVAFIPANGRLYELDGLQPAPIDHGEYGDDWRKLASEVLMERVASFSITEIRFNLLAVVNDVLKASEERVEELAKLGADDTLVREARFKVDEEKSRRARWKRENELRRTNFLPFIVQYLASCEQKHSGLLDSALNKLIAEKEKAAAAEAAADAKKANKS